MHKRYDWPALVGYMVWILSVLFQNEEQVLKFLITYGLTSSLGRN